MRGVGSGCVADIARERHARRGAYAIGSGRRVGSMLAMSIREHVKRQATETFSRNSTDGIFVSLAAYVGRAIKALEQYLARG